MSDFNFDVDPSVLEDEFTRVIVDKKPGANNKKVSSFYDNFVKMPKGDGYVTLRLLPPLPGYQLPYASCRIHDLAPLEQRAQKPPKHKNLYCGRKLKDRKWVGNCFFCEYYTHLYSLADKAKAEGNDELAEQYIAKAKAIKAQEKYYYNAIVLDSNPPTGQSPENGPLIYSCGIQIHRRIVEAVTGNKAMNKKGKGNVFHPINGRNLKVVKEMKPGGQYPEYGGSEWEDPCPLTEDTALLTKWMNSLKDVHDLCKVITVDEMKKAIRVFEGIDVDNAKTFDASFLSDESEVATHQPVVHQPAVSHHTDVLNDVNVEEDPLVDDDFAKNIRAALGGQE